jgi:hypothetical protein
VVADGNGSFLVEWHCDRDEVGIPMVLTFGSDGRPEMASVRVESRDELVGIGIEIATNAASDSGAVQLTAGLSYVLDVAPQLRGAPDGAASEVAPSTGQSFDPRLVVTSSDQSVASIAESDDGRWTLVANAPGSAVIEARITGSEHTATTEVVVVGPPATPSPTDGLFEPGTVASYLAAAMNLQVGAVESPDAAPGVTTALLPACGDLPAFDTSGWSESVQLVPPQKLLQALSIYTLTFADAASAAAWSASLGEAHQDRAGRDCDVIAGVTATYDPVADLDPSSFVMNLDRAGELSVTTARNVVVIAVTGDETPRSVRNSLATTLSVLAA